MIRTFMEESRSPARPGEAARVILFPGGDPSLNYAANATTTRRFDVPPATLGISVITTSGFTTLSLTGETTNFAYLSSGSATAGQNLQASWGAVDGRGFVSIVSGAGQSGALFLIAYFAPIPPAIPGLVRQSAFPSLSRAAATYNFDVPAQGIAKGIIVYSQVTAGAGTVTFAIQDRDANVGVTSNSYVTSAAIASGSGNILRMYPGLTALANFDVSGILGTTPRIVAVVAANPATFATDYVLIP